MDGRVYSGNTEGARYQFTGHEFDGETQFDYHGARYYNRELGRYMSMDPLQTEFTAWSPYNYTFSNPMRFIDPDGKGGMETGSAAMLFIDEFVAQLEEEKLWDESIGNIEDDFITDNQYEGYESFSSDDGDDDKKKGQGDGDKKGENDQNNGGTNPTTGSPLFAQVGNNGGDDKNKGTLKRTDHGGDNFIYESNKSKNGEVPYIKYRWSGTKNKLNYFFEAIINGGVLIGNGEIWYYNNVITPLNTPPPLIDSPIQNDNPNPPNNNSGG